MKKIVFVCDTDNFPTGAFEFIKMLSRVEPFLLTGAFFHSINYEAVIYGSSAFNPEPLIAFSERDNLAVKESILKFCEGSDKAGIEYRVHEESEEYKIDDLVKESRFADLMVLSEEVFFAHLAPQQPNRFMKQVLHRSECPVLVIPENYTPFTRIIFAYDGKKHSMFALKQFCYLFPRYTELSVTLLHLQDEDNDDEIPDLLYIEEYAARQFSSPNIQNINYINKGHLHKWLGNRKDTLLIAGAYSNIGLMTVIRESFVEKTINDHKIPVFIAHNI